MCQGRTKVCFCLINYHFFSSTRLVCYCYIFLAFVQVCVSFLIFAIIVSVLDIYSLLLPLLKWSWSFDSCPQSKRKLTHAKCFCLDVYKFGGTEVNPVISSDCFCSWAKCGNYSGNCVKAVDVAKPRADKLPAYQYKTKTKLKKRKEKTIK